MIKNNNTNLNSNKSYTVRSFLDVENENKTQQPTNITETKQKVEPNLIKNREQNNQIPMSAKHAVQSTDVQRVTSQNENNLQQRGPKPILSIKNLTKKYGERIAVNNISLNLYAGQIIGFLGANGAGKSTTIKMLTGLARITSGDVYICGHSIKEGFENAIKHVGAMIEIPHFYNYLSGYNNLKYFAKLSGNINISRINEVASLVGLSNRIKDKVGNYSLGMKQRLGVAQALLNKPKLLILDEPTNGLDANGIREFRMMLKNLAYREKIAILISSHILGEMENLCDMVAIIDNGKIIQVQTMEQIKNNFSIVGSQYIKCNAPNLAGKILMQKFNCKVKLQGNKVYIDSGDMTLLSRMIVELTKNKILVYAAGEVDYSLEDVFLNIINKNHATTSIN